MTTVIVPGSILTPFREVPAGAVNGANTVFTLTHIPATASEALYDNGVLQMPGTAYTLSGNTFNLNYAPGPGHNLWCTYLY